MTKEPPVFLEALLVRLQEELGLQITDRGLRKWVVRHKFPKHKAGGKPFFYWSEVLDWFQAQKDSPKPVIASASEALEEAIRRRRAGL